MLAKNPMDVCGELTREAKPLSFRDAVVTRKRCRCKDAAAEAVAVTAVTIGLPITSPFSAVRRLREVADWVSCPELPEEAVFPTIPELLKLLPLPVAKFPDDPRAPGVDPRQDVPKEFSEPEQVEFCPMVVEVLELAFVVQTAGDSLPVCERGTGSPATTASNRSNKPIAPARPNAEALFRPLPDTYRRNVRKTMFKCRLSVDGMITTVAVVVPCAKPLIQLELVPEKLFVMIFEDPNEVHLLIGAPIPDPAVPADDPGLANPEPKDPLDPVPHVVEPEVCMFEEPSGVHRVVKGAVEHVPSTVT